MRIVSWNCNGKLREKFQLLLPLDADVYVIQECENPDTCKDESYRIFSNNAVWTGENKSKGLGVFLKGEIEFVDNSWPSYGLQHFISLRIDSKFNLLGVWISRIEEFFIYQNINHGLMNENLIIIGDFNSSKIWDKKHGIRNHSVVVKTLETKGLVSAYHFIKQEEQGAETTPTFYLYRHPNRGYHIDYCFAAPRGLFGFETMNQEEWLRYSDHVPIVVDLHY